MQAITYTIQVVVTHALILTKPHSYYCLVMSCMYTLSCIHHTSTLYKWLTSRMPIRDDITPCIEPGLLLLHGTCAVCVMWWLEQQIGKPLQCRGHGWKHQTETNTHSAWMSYSIHQEILVSTEFCEFCDWQENHWYYTIQTCSLCDFKTYYAHISAPIEQTKFQFKNQQQLCVAQLQRSPLLASTWLLLLGSGDWPWP